MKNTNRFLGLSLSLLTLTVLFAACAASTSNTDASDAGGGGGGSGGTPTPTPTPKAIANSWSNIVGATYILDLTSAVLDGSTPFSATLSYNGSVCTYSLIMSSTSDVLGNCIVESTPVHSGGQAGITTADCVDNTYNVCGTDVISGGNPVPASGKYSWDGTGLSFQNNGMQFR